MLDSAQPYRLGEPAFPERDMINAGGAYVVLCVCTPFLGRLVGDRVRRRHGKAMSPPPPRQSSMHLVAQGRICGEATLSADAMRFFQRPVNMEMWWRLQDGQAGQERDLLKPASAGHASRDSGDL